MEVERSPLPDRLIRVRVQISGIVQGVFFRASTRRIALELGLKGWVRNLPNGRVEAIFEGEEEKVRKALEWCRKGPPGAKVEKVEEFYEPYKGEFETFRAIW
ncbi:MAG: acylphosphatase [Candidatus Bathyarchaeia archaeon]